jgi:hypothetical protein
MYGKLTQQVSQKDWLKKVIKPEINGRRHERDLNNESILLKKKNLKATSIPKENEKKEEIDWE